MSFGRLRDCTPHRLDGFARWQLPRALVSDAKEPKDGLGSNSGFCIALGFIAFGSGLCQAVFL